MVYSLYVLVGFMYILDYSHIVLFLVARVKVCLIPVLCSVLYARTCSDFIRNFRFVFGAYLSVLIWFKISVLCYVVVVRTYFRFVLFVSVRALTCIISFLFLFD